VLLNGVSINSETGSKEELSLLLLHIILNILEHQAIEAKRDLVTASQYYPLHPSLLCLRYLLRLVLPQFLYTDEMFYTTIQTAIGVLAHTL